MELNLRKCNICPRMCGVDRVSGNTGFCGQTGTVKVARGALHMWEEPCISGTRGSGTVFFSGCTLKCSFCQNRQISAGGFGAEISVERLAEIFIRLQNEGAHNINLVSPTQFAPQIIEAVSQSKKHGLNVPVVWNTGGYERPETIAALADTVDIFLADLKYMNSDLGSKFSSAEDYVDFAKSSIGKMVEQTGSPAVDAEGIMRRGVIVRHLVMPGCVKDSKATLKWLYERFGNSIFISIMSQYTPPAIPDGKSPDRPLHKAEYRSVVKYAMDLGIENAFLQELSSSGGQYVPDFDLTGVL